MTLKLKVAPVGRQVAEQWYATLDDGTIEYLSSPREDENDVYAHACLESIETYATQILPAMNDYESALSFVQYNAILDDSRKEVSPVALVLVYMTADHLFALGPATTTPAAASRRPKGTPGQAGAKETCSRTATTTERTRGETASGRKGKTMGTSRGGKTGGSRFPTGECIAGLSWW